MQPQPGKEERQGGQADALEQRCADQADCPVFLGTDGLDIQSQPARDLLVRQLVNKEKGGLPILVQ